MFDKFRRKDDPNVNSDLTILTAPNPTSPITNIHLENRLRHDHETQNHTNHIPHDHTNTIATTHHIAIEHNTSAGFNQNSAQYKICAWLQSHHVWFNDKIGNELMTVLTESGITQPSTELKLLKEWPDLIQIADCAHLNIIQRRKFINAIHDPMSGINTKHDYTSHKLREQHPYHPHPLTYDNINNKQTLKLRDNIHHLPLGFFIPGPMDYYNRYNISGNNNNNNININNNEEDEQHDIDKLRERDNEIKHILVMSDKEQEALARMDSIISQLHVTRNLIRRRCEALDSGAAECENIIRKEFNLLKNLLATRQDYIINTLHENKEKRIGTLNNFDNDISGALQSCHKCKHFVECIVENDTRYCGASWAVLSARKSRAVTAIENTIKQIEIPLLIHTDMDIDNLLAFETFATLKNIDVGMTSIQDWNALNTPSTLKQKSVNITDASFRDIIFKNLKKLEDIEKDAVRQHGFGENSYATHELNVFVRSPSQLRLRMCLPGFSFQRNQKKMHDMIRRYGAITDVEKSVDSQVNQLFKSVAKTPQHTLSAINVLIDAASFVNEITKQFDDKTEIYKFDNHRSLSVEVSVKPNPENAVKAAKMINNAGEDDEEDQEYDDNEYGSPVHIYRIFEVELQICRQPIPPREAIDEYLTERRRRDSYDSEEEKDSNVKYNLSEIDGTLLDWISLGWKKIKTSKYHANRYDEEQEKIRKNISIQLSEDWWKEQRVKLLSKVNLNEWPLRHETGKPDEEIASIIDDHKSVDNIICNDLLMRCRIRDFLKVSIAKNKNDNDIKNEEENNYTDNDNILMSHKDEILVSQSSYSALNFMKYDLRLPPEEPEDHFGVIVLFSDRSLRFYDLYDNKLIILTQGVPGDHINLPALCVGLIPYEKMKKLADIEDEPSDTDSDSNNSHSDSDTLSLKPVGSQHNLFSNESETEYELRPTIIRCGGTLLDKATAFVDMFDIQLMCWKRIKYDMHCKRVYTQSLILNGKLIVIGGEVFDNNDESKKDEKEEKETSFPFTRRISAINESEDDNTAQFSSILRVQQNKSCIEEYDFELKRWDISCILPQCIWNHCVCSIHNEVNDGNNMYGAHVQSQEIFIGGGYSPVTNRYLSQCMIYDMNKDSLINISNMKYLHSCSSAISFDDGINGINSKGLHVQLSHSEGNKIYVIGGQLMGITSCTSTSTGSKQNNYKTLMQAMIMKQFKCVEVYNLNTKKWKEIDSLNYNHGFYPCVWIQNLLDYKQKKSKEEKERLKRMSKMSKMRKNNKNNAKISIDPRPIYTIFVTGNGCHNKTNVEYLDPKTKKWKILSKEIGEINMGEIKSIKQELFKSRKFTPYSIRDDILDRFDKKQKQNNNKYAIIDEL